MHTFTLSLFSSALTPTGSNKGCSITRGNSYLYQTYFINLFHLIIIIYKTKISLKYQQNHWIMKKSRLYLLQYFIHWIGKKLISKLKFVLWNEYSKLDSTRLFLKQQSFFGLFNGNPLIILSFIILRSFLIYIRYSLNSFFFIFSNHFSLYFFVVFSLFCFDSMENFTRFSIQHLLSYLFQCRKKV